MAGTLYLVATPIGNLEDITLRALRVLKEVDLIACEDTRRTRKLLSSHNISKPMISYHEHNERERAVELVDKLDGGADIALVSDAGTPLVSDPGFHLVKEAILRGITITPLPGPSAVTAALAASGLASGEFTFAGFLPARRAARRARLREFAEANHTLIFYEAPHRIKEALRDAVDVLGDRAAVIARELTKIHEDFLRGRLSELARRADEITLKGEMVLLIAPAVLDNQSRPVLESTGASEPAPRSPGSILKEVEQVMRDEGLDQKGALKRVARSRGITRSEAYRAVLAEKAETDRKP
ncbi:MAG TPA: 16S rRNA (cytidine(1402)-2'-O)-methyltransferase [Blastocatellia bacterium]|nr:16S rRNA (cytidine(1402)-2'-O)-methyltransferase [Blastocatellia bacterium]